MIGREFISKFNPFHLNPLPVYTPRTEGDFFGIDFGTTNTAVYLIRKGKLGITSLERKLGENGGYPFPSIIAVPKNQDKEVIFGKGVRERRLELEQDHDIVFSMKSHLGKDTKFELAGEQFSSIEITWALLEYIKSSIKKQSGCDINEAAFSFPLDFSREARRELKQAANAAGIKVTSFLNEATAAYIANIGSCKSASRLMVIDFGGGTLDINILEKRNNKIYEIAVGSEKIGGDDIDLELARRIHSMISSNEFDDISVKDKDQILMVCEEAKIGFTDNDEWIIELNDYENTGLKTKRLSYDWFEEIVDPFIRDRIEHTIHEVMSKAGKNPSSIDAVIIVGGSSNLRPFNVRITKMFGKEKIVKPSADDVQWSVARGAALMGIENGLFTLNDDVGVVLSNDTVYPILKKSVSHVGTKISPISFKLVEDSQSANFIFSDANGNIYAHESIETKGFLEENLQVSAEIDGDQIADIKITNVFMHSNYNKNVLIKKLNFYYELPKGSEAQNVQ
jgi:molecular chaperone DnaK